MHAFGKLTVFNIVPVAYLCFNTHTLTHTHTRARFLTYCNAKSHEMLKLLHQM